MRVRKWITTVLIIVLGLLLSMILTVPLLTTYSSTIDPVIGQPQEQVNNIGTSISLKPNAIELWAGTLQSTYDPSSGKDKNQQQLSIQSIPEGVVCQLTSPIMGWFSSGERKSILRCSGNEFRTSVFITLNYRFVNELIGGDFYFNFNPFTIYGIGEWPEIARLPQIEATDTAKSSKIVEILQLRSNALQIWAGELQTQFASAGNMFTNIGMISKRNIPIGVVCDVNLLNTSIWLLRPEKWKLSCSYDDFRNRIELLINGAAVRGLNDGYINSTLPFTVYGAGEWPESAYKRELLQSEESTTGNNFASQSHNNDPSSKSLVNENTEPISIMIPELRANALQFWAAELQNQFNSTGDIISNSKVMSRRDIPLGVVCTVGEVKSGSSDKGSEKWELDCSNDGLSHINLLVNGNAARGLTGDNYYDIELPFIINGTGLWPDLAYDYQQSFPVQSSSVPNNRYPNNVASSTGVSPTSSTTATASTDTSIVVSRPVVSQRSAWLDRLGAIAVLAAILVAISFTVFAFVRMFQHRYVPVITPKNPTNTSKAEEQVETNSISAVHQKEQAVLPPKVPPVRLNMVKIAKKLCHYKADIIDYEQKFQLLKGTERTNIGEFGMGTHFGVNSQIYQNNEHVCTLIVWLYDKFDKAAEKNPPQKVLLSKQFYNIKKQHPNQLVPDAGIWVELHSQNLLLECIVRDLDYKDQEIQMIFNEVIVLMTVYQKGESGTV